MASGTRNRIEFTPDFLDRYEIQRVLGEGGSGIVYEASQKSLDRVVAVKFLSHHMFREEESVRRFLDECKISARLQHGNIVQIYDFGVMADLPYAVFELISGQPLRSLLDVKGRLTVEESLRITQETLAGLSHAHRLGVVHRDLKPENLLLEPDGRIKIADFGLAKSREKREYKTRAGMVLGTPEYISPEQASGEDATPRSDIYAVGIMLYEMISGRVPFGGTSDLAILMAHVQKEPKSIAELVPAIPTLAAEMVSRALQKKPEDRFPTAEEFAEKIDELQPYLGRSTRQIPSAVVRSVRASSSARQAAVPSPKEVETSRRTLVILAMILGAIVSLSALGAYFFRSGSGTAGHSVRAVKASPGVHTASVEWISKVPAVGVLEIREEGGGEADWRKISEEEGEDRLEHRVMIGELKPDSAYEYRFIHPDGAASLPRGLRTSERFSPIGLEARYQGTTVVALTFQTQHTVAVHIRSRDGTLLSEAGPSGQSHSLLLKDVDPLAGKLQMVLSAVFENGEELAASPIDVPPLTDVLSQQIERFDIAGFIGDLEPKLATLRDRDKASLFLKTRMEAEPVQDTFRVFRSVAPAFFQSARVPLVRKVAVYEELQILENVDALADLYRLDRPLGVAESYRTFVSTRYSEANDQMTDTDAFDSRKWRKGDNAFYPENFDKKDLPTYKATLEVLQGRGRSHEILRLKFRGASRSRFSQALLYCATSNMPPRLYLEAVLNDRLKVIFRNTSDTYKTAGNPPTYIFASIPPVFLNGAENKVELKLKSLPGLSPFFNSLLYEIGLKAE